VSKFLEVSPLGGTLADPRICRLFRRILVDQAHVDGITMGKPETDCAGQVGDFPYPDGGTTCALNRDTHATLELAQKAVIPLPQIRIWASTCMGPRPLLEPQSHMPLSPRLRPDPPRLWL